MTDLEIWLAVPGGDRYVGEAHLTRHRGRVSTTFLYASSYLAAGGQSIDPSLRLDPGAQYVPGLLGALADTAPDRWGCRLIDKGERLRAREESRAARRLDDVDYLLGVSDDTRQGALRIRIAGTSDFLGSTAHVPPLLALPELLGAASAVADDEDSTQALKGLLDTGSTGLGGARPKASVHLEDGALALAKFPYASDRWNVMGWEMVALDLLRSVGAEPAAGRLLSVGPQSVLVLRRFDRDDAVDRIPYLSALTALGAEDGEQHDYVELAQAVRDLSARPRDDLVELYRRAALSVAIGNTDDHLRNHGFLGARRGWRLSPAFDVNPNPSITARRATSLAGADTFPEELDGLVALSEDCDLTPERAQAVIAQVHRGVVAWESVARRHGLAEREIALMAESITTRCDEIARLVSSS